MIGISHDEACRLSRAFNEAANLGDARDRRINEWLKLVIGSAAAGSYGDAAELALAQRVYDATGGKPDDWRRGQKVSAIQIAIRDGNDGVMAPPGSSKRGPNELHEYAPDRKFPWFCSKCGYGRDERLMHPPASEVQS